MAARHVFRWVAKACWRQQDWIDDYSRHNPAYRFAYDVKKERCKIGDDLPVLQRSFFTFAQIQRNIFLDFIRCYIKYLKYLRFYCTIFLHNINHREFWKGKIVLLERVSY